jgi:methyl-accepting chemotaxis protein
MEMLIAPLVRLMAKFTFKQKFSALIAITSVAGVGLLAVVVQHINSSMATLSSERVGIEYSKVVLNALQDRQTTILAGPGERAASQGRLDAALKAVAAFDATHGNLLTAYSSAFATPDAPADSAALGFTLLASLSAISTQSHLALDSNADTYFLAQSAIRTLPTYANQLVSLAVADATQKRVLGEQLQRSADIVRADFNSLNTLNAGAGIPIKPAFTEFSDTAAELDAALKKGAPVALQGAFAATLNLARVQLESLDQLVQNRMASYAWQRGIAVGVTVFALLTAIYLAAGFYLGLRRTLSAVREGAVAVANDDLAHRVVAGAATSNDEAGEVLHAMDEMQDRLFQRTIAERRVASANKYIREALDQAESCVLICDSDYKIVYANAAAQSLFEKVESNLRQDLPSFNAANIVGASLDVLSSSPEQQREYLSRLKGVDKKVVTIGKRSFGQVFSVVCNAENIRCGFTVEWADITDDLALVEQQNKHVAELEGQMTAINRVQAVIEFGLDGRILHANENFLKTLGYTLEELKGQHHSCLVDAAYSQSNEYRLFWERLGRGEYDAAQYKRIGKGGREVWIQASYNPIHDSTGKPYKVVKYATDVTEQVKGVQALQHAVAETQLVVTSAREGDLTRRVMLDDKSGSVRDLCGGVNSLVESMADVVGKIRASIDTINDAAREISTGNTDLSSRTEQQAASLEQTASSMEELTSTVKQNAGNAIQANQLAISAAEVAAKGGQVVGEVVQTMSAINQSSKKIVDIISVIDGIAFQTNILALNAAVEAARAGEQGRGFAVVASEVRSLAQRSAGAAKEIKSLIGDSVEKVGNGSALVEQAGSTMAEIVASVKHVTDIMAEISAASQEQSKGIEQVNQTIAQMEEVTQQNAALVEEASASATSLEQQSDSLTQMVSRFKVADGDTKKNVESAERDAEKPVSRPGYPLRRSSGQAPKSPLRTAVAAPRPAASGRSYTVAGGANAGQKWTEF